MNAIYPGSFDPITNGHLNIIERSAKVFDKVTIAVMINPTKTESFFSVEERIDLIQKSVKDLKNVNVISSDKLTLEVANSIGAGVIIRGIRAVMDYEKELQNATANMALDDSIETIFFVSEPQYSYISSSAVKEIALFGGDVDGFVEGHVKEALINKFSKGNV